MTKIGGMAPQRRDVLKMAGSLALLGAGMNRAFAQGSPVKIGVLNDQNGPYSDQAGPGSVVAVKMAVEDFGPTVLGRPIQIVVGDHQNKADIGVAIAREWLGPGDVSMITDFANSSIALGVRELLGPNKKIGLFTGVSTTELIGKSCTPYGSLWGHDTWAISAGLVRAAMAKGAKTFYFITADYSFGHSLQADATGAAEAGGGKVVGTSLHPVNSNDFSSYLLAARSSKADAVVLANGGADLTNCLKQAAEFGLTKRQSVLTPLMFIVDVHSLGLEIAQGLTFTQSTYWDMNDETRAWAKRFFAQRGKMASDSQVACYSATLQYLKAVQRAGTLDADAVMKELRATTISDVFTKNGKIREDGKMVYDRVLVRVKKPEESKYPWDYCEVLGMVPAAEAFRPLALSKECSMVKL
ncbi:ABC transporter substrate-binding protein [uncultured Alsobacter sp.]|uniref:ABC transporter substrate-binding protein n=1 Tax=uncultured Alsobacter sp. TaxID=1748258 RepID=UPI0025E08A8E|nr:ABC transporter substrate-binding protein [uncultured Alsobacter sp.]